MQRSFRLYLQDVDTAAADIQKFIDGLTVQDYQKNNMLRAAVERKFIIIGEALSQLKRAEPSLKDEFANLRKIISFRNRIIHEYSVVSHRTVWEIAQIFLPELRLEVQKLLQKLPLEHRPED